MRNPPFRFVEIDIVYVSRLNEENQIDLRISRSTAVEYETLIGKQMSRRNKICLFFHAFPIVQGRSSRIM